MIYFKLLAFTSLFLSFGIYANDIKNQSIEKPLLVLNIGSLPEQEQDLFIAHLYEDSKVLYRVVKKGRSAKLSFDKKSNNSTHIYSVDNDGTCFVRSVFAMYEKNKDFLRVDRVKRLAECKYNDLNNSIGFYNIYGYWRIKLKENEELNPFKKGMNVIFN